MSPQWLDRVERFRFRRRSTFDSGATPTVRGSRPVATMADVDLAAINEQMAEAVTQAEANDPKLLRRRVAELEAELRRAETAPAVPEQVEVPAVDDATIGELEDLVAAASAAAAAVTALAPTLEAVRAALAAVRGGTPDLTSTGGSVAPISARFDDGMTTRAPVPVGYPADASPLTTQQGKLLREAVRRHPMSLTEAQLSTMSGYSRRSSTWRPTIRGLVDGGYLSESGGQYQVTAAGLAVFPGEQTAEPVSGAALVEMWCSKLPKQAAVMLRTIVDLGDGPGVTEDELAERTGYSKTSSTFKPSIRMLVKHDLVTLRGDRMLPSDDLR